MEGGSVKDLSKYRFEKALSILTLQNLCMNQASTKWL